MLRISYTSIQNFLSCQRKYEWSKVYGLKRKSVDDGDARTLGTLVHAGFEKALDFSFHQDGEYQISQIVSAGRYGVIDKYNTILKRGETEDYYQLMQALREKALEIVAFQIPMLDIGVKYRVASHWDVFGGEAARDEALLEYKFQYEYGDHTITGIIDAVLQDLDTGELSLVDFKCRKSFIDDTAILMDGQLPFYATMLSMAGNTIRSTIQWQVSSSVPKLAKINKDGKTPSVAAIKSTWAVWSQSLLNMGIDPEPYKDEMMPKLHDESEFYSRVYRPVTESVRQEMIRNLDATIESLVSSTLAQNFPANLSAYSCEYCDFKRLCLGRLAGARVSAIIEADFEVDNQPSFMV